MRRGDTGPGVTPKHAMSCDRLHASTDCISASMNARMSRIRVCTSGVSRGILPSGGSTIIDVIGPSGLDVSIGSASKVVSYAPVRSSSVPRGAMRSPRLGAEAACCARSASRRVTSSGVSIALFASRAGRCSGVWYFCDQRPWMSGSPHAVLRASPAAVIEDGWPNPIPAATAAAATSHATDRPSIRASSDPIQLRPAKP